MAGGMTTNLHPEVFSCSPFKPMHIGKVTDNCVSPQKTSLLHKIHSEGAKLDRSSSGKYRRVAKRSEITILTLSTA